MTRNINIISEKERLDITELKNKIVEVNLGLLPDEIFNQYRLTKGVYGQRQTGSQMIRIKIPYGKLTSDQLIKIANISEKYANGKFHITTRQNIQYHFVKLNDTPKIWEELSSVGLTLREACGNTVRNITGSATAGINSEELFDVSPYIQAVYEYLLRNPICQNLGRKIKIAFSSNEEDSAFTYFNDLGFIPKINNNSQRGFKVVIGGGLGAQSMVAQTAFEFLDEILVIPFIEAVLRVFDRYGERNSRNKARLKYLIKKIGLTEFLDFVNEEMQVNKYKEFKIILNNEKIPNLPEIQEKENVVPVDKKKFAIWKKTNVFEQKQAGYYGIKIRIKLGNITSDIARELAFIIKKYAADDIRLTLSQGLILKFVRKESLPAIFNLLSFLELADPGSDSVVDITACPGTDTCNLGITNTTYLAKELENIILKEFPDLLDEKYLKIKISGCMNSCGQHMAANIGFYGTSIKVGNNVLPAMQLVLGGGVDFDGFGNIADRIRKIPTKRVPQLLKVLLSDFKENALDGEYFNAYYKRLGINYFSTLVQPLENISTLQKNDFVDWGKSDMYIQKIGIGECAGVNYDAVSHIINETKQKLKFAEQSLDNNDFADSIYHSYNVFVNAAKAMLLANDIRCNTHISIIKDFQKYQSEIFTDFKNQKINFDEIVLKINKNLPSKQFATKYFEEASNFLNATSEERKK